LKDILDIIIAIVFVAMLAMFIVGFNRQMLAKHKKRLEDIEKLKEDNKNKDKTDD